MLLFDHRHFGLSQSPISSANCGQFSRDLEGAVTEMKRESARRVFLVGASFGGVTSMVAGSRLGSRIAGVVSVSGEKQLANRCGPATELDALATIPKLRAPFLILGSREDGYLLPRDARELERRAGSEQKRLVLFPGGYHGWDILDVAPYQARASRLLIDFLHHPD